MTPPALHTLRRAGLWWPAGLAAGALLLAGGLRYGLVEPASLTARCDAAPWSDAACVLRTLTIQSFIQHRVAWLALACALLAVLLRARLLAAGALALACTGLMLYSTALAAPAAVLAALVLARPSAGAAPR